jgi:hypothetical protein
MQLARSYANAFVALFVWLQNSVEATGISGVEANITISISRGSILALLSNLEQLYS